ncbi:hypothetical protein NZK35_06525 [Stieleria sp. ICT_E10.1]|uniref:hypothetical protein n=1 Tax=Stieleria sedimenti TaxID=2976331 RepID=UPI00217F2D7C|nr:hypothetical protein [Stieleria sedimenti]MCS7466329.1 hypothetical protein [Stieleria sedimenti]
MNSNSLERDASQLTRNIDRINEASLDLPRLLQRAKLAGRVTAGQKAVDSIDGKQSSNIHRETGWQRRREYSAIRIFSRFRFRADKLTTPLIALWSVIAWLPGVTRIGAAMVIVRTVLVLVIMVVRLEIGSITTRMVGTHCGRIGVMMMQATP